MVVDSGHKGSFKFTHGWLKVDWQTHRKVISKEFATKGYCLTLRAA